MANVNKATKYVASNTRASSEWGCSVFLSGDIAGEVAKLKQQQGPDLHVWGSGEALQTLMKHDLVDVFWLMLYPITLGSGKRVCGWHDPCEVQSDGKRSHAERYACCGLRTHVARSEFIILKNSACTGERHVISSVFG